MLLLFGMVAPGTQELSDLVEMFKIELVRLSVVQCTKHIKNWFIANLDGHASNTVDTNKG